MGSHRQIRKKSLRICNLRLSLPYTNTNHCTMNLAQRTLLAYEYQQFERNLYGAQHAAPLQVPTITQSEQLYNIIQCYS